MSAHTPGPWVSSVKVYGAKTWNPGDIAVQINAKGGAMVASFDASTCEYPSKAETKANARLIAAAPELLAGLIGERQLRQLGQEPDVHWESLKEARRAASAMTDAAIAKATGAA